MTFEEQLRSTGKLIYTNKGISMMPLIREGRDVMVIEDCSGSEVQRLDAVLFTREQRQPEGASKTKKDYVLHRVMRINPDGTFWIIGDNCTSGEIVRGEQIIGRLTAVIRDGRTVSTSDAGYRRYVNLWCRPYRLRIFILRIKSFIRRGLRYVWRHVMRRR